MVFFYLDLTPNNMKGKQTVTNLYNGTKRKYTSDLANKGTVTNEFTNLTKHVGERSSVMVCFSF